PLSSNAMARSRRRSNSFGVPLGLIHNSIGTRRVIYLTNQRSIKALHAILVQRGYQAKLFTKVATREENGEIDILAWTSRAPREILLIEAKFVLPADEVNEVKDLTERLRGGQKQAERCLRILDGLSARAKREVFKFVPWESIEKQYAIVVNNEGVPNSAYAPERIPSMDLPVLKQRLRPRDWRRPELLWEAARSREWLADVRRMQPAWRPVSLGEVVYEVPVREGGEE
ncbi:MAG: hypothetical protein IID37_12840, partial [Planctomycetes bacterium]|nr:hypothetical protein [Planctomycetota bacterium]